MIDDNGTIRDVGDYLPEFQKQFVVSETVSALVDVCPTANNSSSVCMSVCVYVCVTM